MPPLLNPPLTSLPIPPQSIDFECPASYIELPLAIYFTYGSVYVSVLFSHSIPPSPSPTVSKMSVSPLMSYKEDYQYYLSRFFIYTLYEWIRMLQYIYTIDYCSTIKMNTFESVLME